MAYHLIATYRFFGQAVKPHLMIAVSIAAALFIGYTSTAILAAWAPETQEDFIAAVTAVAYTVLDAILIIPALIVLASLRHGNLTSTPWMILASSFLIVVAADSGFAYYEAVELKDEIWIWDLFYSTSYITMAATLFWHYRFFIYHEKKAKKIWQEENR